MGRKFIRWISALLLVSVSFLGGCDYFDVYKYPVLIEYVSGNNEEVGDMQYKGQPYFFYQMNSFYPNGKLEPVARDRGGWLGPSVYYCTAMEEEQNIMVSSFQGRRYVIKDFEFPNLDTCKFSKWSLTSREMDLDDGYEEYEETFVMNFAEPIGLADILDFEAKNTKVASAHRNGKGCYFKLYLADEAYDFLAFSGAIEINANTQRYSMFFWENNNCEGYSIREEYEPIFLEALERYFA